MSGELFTLVIVPLLIFIARVIDVSIGTIRLIFISKGHKLVSSVLGFFEVIIWLVAITRIMDNLDNIYAYLAYGLGFATGTYVGIVLEQRIALGKVIVRIITKDDAKDLVEELRDKNYTFTSIGVDGPGGIVQSIHVIINKRDLHKLISYLVTVDPDAYYSVEDITIVTEKPIHRSIPMTMRGVRGK